MASNKGTRKSPSPTGQPPRVNKKLRKEAEALTDSLSSLSDVAFQRTLAFIMEELKSDKNLTNTLAPLIRDGTLSQMLSMEKISGKEMEKGKRLPPSCKRFKHLRDNMVKLVLQSMEPKLDDVFFEKCPLEVSMLLTLGLNVRGERELPRAWFPPVHPPRRVHQDLPAQVRGHGQQTCWTGRPER